MIATRTSYGFNVVAEQPGHADHWSLFLPFPEARALGVLTGGPLPLGAVTKRAQWVATSSTRRLVELELVTMRYSPPRDIAELTELGAQVAAAITEGAR